MANIFKELGDYVREMIDADNNGIVTVKELFSVLPHSAVAIALLVVDLLMLVAEYRVWDAGMYITHDPYKALGFVLVSAVPFYLAQLLWLYPRANLGQLGISILMIAASLYTSAMFGLADLSQQYDVTRIVNQVIRLTVAYIVGLLVYVLLDKSIRLKRAVVRSRDNAAFEQQRLDAGRQILDKAREMLAYKQALINEFGEKAVKAQLESMLPGKSSRSNDQRPKPQVPATPATPPVTESPPDVNADFAEAFKHKNENPQPPSRPAQQ